MTAAAPLLELENVAKSYRTAAGELPVLRGVSLALAAGEFAALTGPSGSGKTTLLHLAGLLDRPGAGRIRLEGQDVSALGEATRSRLRALRCGMVFQHFHLLPHRTVRENVRFRFRYTGTPAREAERRTDEAIERVGLSERSAHPARLLSGGEMQRVAIARAVAISPALLLADEPTGNLDAAAAQAVMAQFVELARQGIAVLLATHNPALLVHCHRCWTLDGGRLRPA